MLSVELRLAHKAASALLQFFLRALRFKLGFAIKGYVQDIRILLLRLLFLLDLGSLGIVIQQTLLRIDYLFLGRLFCFTLRLTSRLFLLLPVIWNTHTFLLAICSCDHSFDLRERPVIRP